MTRQISFDPFDYEAQAIARCIEQGINEEASHQTVRTFQHQLAKAARDNRYWELKKRRTGPCVTRFTLKNQLEKYQSFGVEGRGYRDVYFIQVNE